MTEVTPILENTRFSSIFEYNRFMTPLLFLGGSFCVKSNRGIRRLLLDIAVVSNEDSDDRLGGIISNNLNVRGLRYSNFGVDCQMEVAFGFAVDTDGFMVVYTADYLL